MLHGNGHMIILVSISLDPVSGWGTLTYNYAHALWGQGVPFVLLLPRSARVPDVPFSGAIKRILPDLPLSFGGPKSLFSLFRLWRSIPYVPSPGSLVHSLVDFPYAVLGYRFARSRGLPFVMNAIGTYSVAPFSRFPDRHLFLPAYLSATRIVAISRYTASRMARAAGVSRDIDVVYLPAAFPVPRGEEDFSVMDALPAGRRYILTVSSPRAIGRKGFDIVSAAVSSLVPDFPDIHLVAVGGTAHSTAACTVFPRVSAARLAALYARSYAFVAAPRESGGHFEGYGLVYREAGLYGKPVVGTVSGGVPEAVSDGITGFLVPENSPDRTASALRRLLDDPSFASRIGEVGRRQAAAWTWDMYAEETGRIYAGLLSRP